MPLCMRSFIPVQHPAAGQTATATVTRSYTPQLSEATRRQAAGMRYVVSVDQTQVIQELRHGSSGTFMAFQQALANLSWVIAKDYIAGVRSSWQASGVSRFDSRTTARRQVQETGLQL